MTTTTREFADKCARKRQNTFARQVSDGPMISFIKWFFGLNLWHCAIERFIVWRLRDPYKPVGRPEALAAFNHAVEQFWILWTAVLGLSYVSAVALSRSGTISNDSYGEGARAAGLAFVSVVSSFRVLEVLAVSFRLHVLEKYRTDSPAHALVLTFVAYLQASVCFAILFLASAVVTGDKFADTGNLWCGFFDALYFSTITIATVGYGDFSPTHWLGKILVIAEVFVGLVLVVVAFQRVLASSPDRSSGP
jgi:voltage-gated potassium channel Kch